MSNLADTIIILCLIGSNLFTIWYYHRHFGVLIDKSMSKSYPDYIQAKNLEQANHFPQASTQENLIVEDDQVLNELNSIIK